MTTDELKARRLAGQHITRKTDRLTAARDLCGFQAQFAANPAHAMKIRCTDFSPDTAGEGLVKNWTVRGTIHVFAESDLPVFKYRRDSHPHRSEEWRGYRHRITHEWVLSPDRQRELSRAVLAALESGPRPREELKEILRAQGMTEREESVMFESWGGGMRDLCERGFINYAPLGDRVFALAPHFEPMDEDDALLEQVKRYFTHFAPVTLRDAAYFFGKPQSKIKAVLDRLPVETVGCAGRTYFYIDRGETDLPEIPGCVFLAGFDQLMLGYRKEDNPFLPAEHLRGIFNLAGIVMPALLLRGEVAGRWKYKDGRLTVEEFAPLYEHDRKDVSSAAEELWADLKKIEWK